MLRHRPGLAVLVIALAAGVAALRAAPASDSGAVHWPQGELSRHVQAWFAQLGADDEAARAFFRDHYSQAALAQVPIEQRLERRRASSGELTGLVPLAVVQAEPTSMSVRCRATNGIELVAEFSAEAEAGHRLTGVHIEADTGGPGGPGPARPAGPPLGDAEAVKTIVARLDSEAAAGRFSGVALLARDGRPLLERAWGLADREHRLPATPNTRFNVASIGKVFTRVALAQLAEQGRLSLDDTLARYLPDYPHADSITLDMLAEHRSGVGDFFGPLYESADHARLRHNRDYLPLFRDKPLWFAPGTSQRYSNGGYILLGEVIAKASGEDYYDYLARHVFAPALMRATSAPIRGDGTPNLAVGYTRDGHPSEPERDNAATLPARGSAAGGSYSTAGDLLALDRALADSALAGPGWSAWVYGGPRPDRGNAIAADAEPMSFAFAGGARGISTEWAHEGSLALIVLTNHDPETTRAVLEPVHDAFRRMNPGSSAR